MKNTKTYHRKHDHVNMRLCHQNQRNINNLMPPQGPPSPFETLGLAILQRTCDMFQKSIKRLKSIMFHYKRMLAQLPYKSVLILTISNQVGAPGAPPDPPRLFTGTMKAA